MSTDVGNMAAADAISGLSPAKRALLEKRLAERASNVAASSIGQRPAGSVVPLTHAQRLLWLFDRVSPAATAYNMPEVFRVAGDLDVGALQRAAGYLVERHESLRTVIGGTENEPVLDVRAPRDVALELHDVSESSSPEDIASSLIREAVHRPFNLCNDVLLRLTVVRMGAGAHRIALVTHHIASDGWSRGVMLRELAEAYGAFCEGRPPALPPVPVQFTDFAWWLDRELSGPRVQSDLAYWRGQLAGELPVLDLPSDRSRTTRHRGGATLRRTLPATVRESVQRVARAHNATPYMLLLAAWQATLGRHAGQQEIVVGAPQAGRGRREVDATIGYFVNTVPMRTSLAGDPTFADLLVRVRETVLDAIEHSAVPLEMIVAQRSVQTGEPLFRVLFSLQNQPSATTLSLRGLDVKSEPAMDLPAKADLTLGMVERADGLMAALEYSTEMFDDATAEGFLRRFFVLLQGALASPQSRVSELPLLDAGEHQRVLTSWNATSHEYDAFETLASLFDEQVRRTPHAPAARFGANALTFRELDRRARAVAQLLHGAGIDCGARVGVLLDRSIELVVALVAIVKSGAAYVPVDPEYPADRVQYMLTDAAIELVLTQARHAPLVRDVAYLAMDELPVPTLVDSDVLHVGEAAAPRSTDPAYIIYTSGSTGAPKGVVVPHSAIVNHMRWMQRAFPLQSDDIVLQKTPVSFDASVWEFWAPLLSGGVLLLAAPGVDRDPDSLVSVLVSERVTVLQVVPSVLAALLDVERLAECRSLKRIFCGGEALPSTLVSRALAVLDVEVHNLYGPAEATIDATVWSAPRRVSWTAGESVTIGRPIDNVTVYVLSPSLQLQPPGVVGEIFIGGAGVATGYFGRPELTRERFIPDPFSQSGAGRLYKTGDLGRWRSNGEIEFVGRTDHQVKVRGVRVELGEVESALRSRPGIVDAVAVAHDDSRGPRIVAFVVVSDRADIDVPAMRASLARVLPAAVVPSTIRVLAAMPLLPNGKSDRRALASAALGDIGDEYMAPRDDIEDAVAIVWGDVLGLDRVSVESNFFEMGGHSLLATRITSRIAKIFGTSVSLREFFDAPTVAQIAQSIRDADQTGARSARIARLFLQVRRRPADDSRRPAHEVTATNGTAL